MAKRNKLPEDAYGLGKKTLRPLGMQATRTLPVGKRTHSQLTDIVDTYKRYGKIGVEISLRVRKRSISGACHYIQFTDPGEFRAFVFDLCRWIKCKAAVYVEQERKGCVRHKDAFLGPLND